MLRVSSASFASNIPTQDHVALCNLHYSKVAYGKEVGSVLVHVGLQNCPLSGDSFCSDVKDIDLENSGEAFTGQVRLDAYRPAYDRCAPTPAIQFWINFKDGSSKIENAVLVQPS